MNDCVLAGDNDAVLVLLLIPRLMAKCELLMTQVRDKVGSLLCLWIGFCLTGPISLWL